MKRLNITWNIGIDENGKILTKRQNINLPEEVTTADAESIANILNKYSKYEILEAQLLTTESVGDYL
ncbi:MAG: hypothetical protein ACK4R7_05705 [Fervidobacterium sp.]